MCIDRLKVRISESIDELLRTDEEIDRESWDRDDKQAEFEDREKEVVVDNPQNQPDEAK
jgi:hypothetical protein